MGSKMNRVRITAAAVHHPPNRLTQAEAAERLTAAIGDGRRIGAIARGSRIEGRSLALPPDEVGALGSIGARNALYEKMAPRLASQVVAGIAKKACLSEVGILVTSSCTGYMVPGWDVQLAQTYDLSPTTVRLPITEAGCAGGVVATARATDYLRVHGGKALVVAVELCSLALHLDPEDGNLTSALIFGDGAGALLLDTEGSASSGIEMVDSTSMLIPCSRDALGFALTDSGFYPLLARELADLLPDATHTAVSTLLDRNGLGSNRPDFCLVHPGGPRVLEAVQSSLGLSDHDLRWSWQSLREFGNTSSAAILDVVRRYLEDEGAPKGWGIVIAFGPGVSIELLLVRRC
jgi:alkylresorcinol/alkylpyrone synthase